MRHTTRIALLALTTAATLATTGCNRPGAVWMTRSLPLEQRDASACVASALLLYQPE